MAYDKFLIAPYKSGLKKDMTTWLTPRDSFKNLENVNLNKGKIVKRFGGKFVGGNPNTSRVRVKVGTTDGTGDLSAAVPGIIRKIGQTFTIGSNYFTVHLTGTPAAMLSSDVAAGGTFDTTNGNFVITGSTPLTDVYWYPSEPIMGITHYELGPVNEHITYVMDTQFIYKFDGSSFILDTTFTGAFTGANTDFFWSANFVGIDASNIALFTTNFTQADTMQYYDNTSWNNFSAVTKFNSNQDIIQTAKIIIPWKGRLLLLNIIEKTIAGPTYTAFTNRVRFSHYLDAISKNAWLDLKESYVSGATTYKGDGASHIDLPLQQQITSAVVIKDRLIVYCERSTWELVYTGNPGLPFTWRSINTSIGSESTFSTVDFINEAVTISTNGIFACNGTDVERIDKDIPDEVFNLFKSAEGTKRIQGVRDTYNNLVYFSVLEFEASTTHTFPNKILVFNYKDYSWSFFDDTITAFGYFEQSANINWSKPGIWDTNDSWGSYYQQGDSRFILAGNHQGFLFTVNSDHPENAEAMYITDITLGTGKAVLTIPDHNLTDGEFIKVDTGAITYNGNNIFKVNRINADGIYITSNSFAGVYLGKGYISRVSKISIQSNDWNPYVKEGDNVYLAKMDFCVKNTQDCEMTVDYDLDALGWSFIREGKNTLSNMGTNILELHAYAGYNIEKYKDVLWRTVYFQASGDFVNITLSMSDNQMLDPNKSLSPFELQGMILYTMRGNK